MRIGSVAFAADLPQLRVLCAGLARHAPGVRATALVLAPRDVLAAREPFDSVALGDVAGADAEALLAGTVTAALRDVLAPRLLSSLRAEGEGGAALLPPDVDVLGPLPEPVPEPGQIASHRTLPSRPLDRDALFHFDGFRPDRPYWLSEHSSDTRVVGDPVLSALCGSYARRVREAGWTRRAWLAGQVLRLADGLPYDERVRALHAQSLAEGRRFGDVLSDRRAAAKLTRWLAEPVAPGKEAGLNRYHHVAYAERADLRTAYPRLEAGDAEGFAGWLRTYGGDQLGMPGLLLPGGRPGRLRAAFGGLRRGG